MLSVTEEFPQVLLEKPVEIADPVQPLVMDNHPEPIIDQERPAGDSGFLIVTIDRDDCFEIA